VPQQPSPQEQALLGEQSRALERAPESKEGERSSPSGDGGARSSGAAPSISSPAPPDPEVRETAQRRHYPASYKLRVLREADRCTKPGEIGALLRREGIYSSLLSSWRRQQRLGELDGLGGKKRGRKAEDRDKLAAENKRLRREKARIERKLKQAELIIDIQKKASEMLGIPLNSPELDEDV